MKFKTIIIASLLSLPGLAFAHGGEDHGAAAVQPNTGNKPQRLSDGSVFIPKATQYQLGIKTQLSQTTTAAKTLELNGHVVMDPNRGARVQASVAGRVTAPASGLPLIGAQVKKGQILARIAPAQGSYETAQRQAELAQTTVDLAQAEKTLQRLRELEGSVPRKEIDAAQANLNALRARSSALSNVSQGEVLRAPVDGVIAASYASNGQVVEAGGVLFDVLDPKGFLIEAMAFDPALIGQITGGAFNGQPLRYLGGARALRDGALPLLFAPSAAMPLALGQVVKVQVQLRDAAGEAVRGTVLPASAVVKNQSNQNIVWVLAQAQTLRPQPVQVMPLDGKRVLITGLKDGQRVVIDGANLINQIR